MHPPLIRVADARDNDAIIDLSLRAWRPVFESYPSIWGRPLFERFYPDWAARQASDVAKALNTNPTWVVAVDETVAGFVNVTFDDQTLTGEIYMIAVDPDHQHRGLGSLLTQHALSQMRARGLTLAMVSTGGDPGHGRARATYERNGFVPFPQVLYSMLLQTDLGQEPKLPSGAAATGDVGLSADSPDLGDRPHGVRLERIDYYGIDPTTYRSIRHVLDSAFDDDEGAESLQDFSDFDHWFVVVDDSEVVAVTGLLVRTIFVGEHSITVAGIGGVGTDVRHRNHGYASRLVDDALRFAQEHGGTPFGLLQCVRDLVPFYTVRGWQVVAEDLICRQSDGNTIRSHELPMVIQLDSSRWPPGPIDMNGLPW